MSGYSSYQSPSESRFRWALIIVMLLLLVYLNRDWLLGLFDRSGYDPDAQPRPVTARGDLAADEQATIEVFDKVSPSVVFVTTQFVQSWRRSLLGNEPMQVQRGTGSGFIWDQEGHIVTNYHVVAEAVKLRGQCKVRLRDGKEFNARVIGADSANDIAVLFIRAPSTELKPIPIGQSKGLLIGQKVFAIGNPFGYDYTFSSGIVSSLERTIRTQDGRELHSLIQTDAAISSGSSGGPLLDSAGLLIGMTTAVATGQINANIVASNIGFAIPVDIINRVVPELIKKQGSPEIFSQPSIGASLVAEKVLRLNNIPTGVMILKVDPDSPAAKAGLQGIKILPENQIAYGDLILAVNGHPVSGNADFQTIILQHKPGDKLVFKVMREGQEFDVEVTLGSID
jgi:S1-C subfamily serine protease